MCRQRIQYAHDAGQEVHAADLWTGRTRRPDGAAIICTSAGHFHFILRESKCKFELELPWKMHFLGKWSRVRGCQTVYLSVITPQSRLRPFCPSTLILLLILWDCKGRPLGVVDFVFHNTFFSVDPISEVFCCQVASVLLWRKASSSVCLSVCLFFLSVSTHPIYFTLGRFVTLHHIMTDNKIQGETTIHTGRYVNNQAILLFNPFTLVVRNNMDPQHKAALASANGELRYIRPIWPLKEFYCAWCYNVWLCIRPQCLVNESK